MGFGIDFFHAGNGLSCLDRSSSQLRLKSLLSTTPPGKTTALGINLADLLRFSVSIFNLSAEPFDILDAKINVAASLHCISLVDGGSP